MSFLRKQESRGPGGNRDSVFEMVSGFRRDGVWIPVFTGMTDIRETFFKGLKYYKKRSSIRNMLKEVFREKRNPKDG